MRRGDYGGGGPSLRYSDPTSQLHKIIFIISALEKRFERFSPLLFGAAALFKLSTDLTQPVKLLPLSAIKFDVCASQPLLRCLCSEIS